MKQRFVFLIISFVSLTAGALDYAVYRQDTFIGNLLSDILCINGVSLKYFHNFFAYYLPDFLWAFSLACALFSVLLPNHKKAWIWGGIVSLYGVSWELAQLTGLISGTADWMDVLMYVTAALSVVMVNFYWNKGRQT